VAEAEQGEAGASLPLAARDAFAELLMQTFGEPDRGAVLEAALAMATGAEPAGGSARARAAVCLHEAGFEESTRWRARAVATLGAYLDAARVAPVGTGLEQRLAQARVLFGARLYFEVHEVLEPAWLAARGEEKRWLQGLIQAAVAWHHWSTSNRRGATSLARAAADKLREAPSPWHGLPLAEVGSTIAAWATWLEGGGGDPPPARAFETAARDG